MIQDVILQFFVYVCKDPFSKSCHIHRFKEIGCGHKFLGATVQPTAARLY